MFACFCCEMILLCFRLDSSVYELLSSSFLGDNNTKSIVSYLRFTDSNRHFATFILKILIEDRRTTYTERINNSRNIVTMHPVDIVMIRTTV